MQCLGTDLKLDGEGSDETEGEQLRRVESSGGRKRSNIVDEEVIAADGDEK